MLTIQNISYYLGSRPLYEDASLHIRPKDRIGLIGKNGTGKTTLLKLICGMITPDKGSIARSNDCTIGFLNQDLLSYESDEPILNVAMQAFEEQLRLQRQIDEVLHQMEHAYEDQLLDRLAHLQERFQILDGYSMQARAEEVLEGLGFQTADLQKPLRKFSGGWRMRVMLAKLLLQRPALLLLDEPTNHLDMPSIQWMENYIQMYEGAVIIVSHDRQFLDNATNIIVEVFGAKLNVYQGNYSYYLEEKALRTEIQNNAYQNQQQMIRQTERFIERFRAKASKARQVQSKAKMLDRIDMIESVAEDKTSINIRFSFSQQPGKVIFQLKNGRKAFGDLLLFQKSNVTLERGDKIAFIGANGKGKSTLLRIIAGTEPVEGERELGYNVIPAFFAQHQLEALTLDNEILQELKQAGSQKLEAELRTVLGCFLFAGDEVFKKIKVLSGGEKSRVALAKTLISEANFLLLDEPTNHLDIQSVNILIQALQSYEGSYVVVSHDRHFVAHIANKIWYIEDQQVKEYPGTYDEYEYWQSQRKAQAATAQQPAPKAAAPKAQPAASQPAEKPKANNQKRIAELEAKIYQLESEKQSLEDQLALPANYGNTQKLADLTHRHAKVADELRKLTQEWEQMV